MLLNTEGPRSHVTTSCLAYIAENKPVLALNRRQKGMLIPFRRFFNGSYENFVRLCCQ